MNSTKKVSSSASPQPVFRLKTSFVAIAACFMPWLYANPVGPVVVNGAATLATQGSTLTVTNTPGAILNWQQFNIAKGQTTQFNQQSAQSSVLNRVVGVDPSQILGTLRSNGNVFLINPNGILFGAGSVIDVNRLVASTLNITNADFLANNLKFNSGSGSSVLNQGQITTPMGGSVYLIGNDVTNQGVITTPGGQVLLAAGKSISLVDAFTPNVSVTVTAPAGQALNLGKVSAAGGSIDIYAALVKQQGVVSANSASLDAAGRVVLSASQAAEVAAGSSTSASNSVGKGGSVQILAPQVALAGAVDASGAAGGGSILVGGDFQGKNAAVANALTTRVASSASLTADATGNGDGGKVIVWANDSTQALGSISAMGGALGGNGGLIETSGHVLDVSGISVNAKAPKGLAGTWLLDPIDVTIYSSVDSGGAFTGTGTSTWTPSAPGSTVSNTTIQMALDAGTNVTITTAGTSASDLGNITVYVPIAATGTATTLTLQADNRISLNGPINLTAGALTLRAKTLSLYANVQAKKVSLFTDDPITVGTGTTVIATDGAATPAGTLTFGNYTASTTMAPRDLTLGTGGWVDVANLASLGGTGVYRAPTFSFYSDNKILFGSPITIPGNLDLKAVGDINITGMGVNSSGAITLSATNLNLTASGSGAGLGGNGLSASLTGNITLTGGSAGTNSAAQLFSTGGPQTISANGITLNGGTAGQGNAANISSTGSQDITVGAGGLNLNGGGGSASETGNAAMISQSGTAGTHQKITVNSGGNIILKGGSSAATNVGTGTGSGSFATIYGTGDTQTLDFTAGGALQITGGTVGSKNMAGVAAETGAQTITGAPTITLAGGVSGGVDGEGNFAFIQAKGGAQNITSGAMTVNGGAGGLGNSAFIEAAQQNISVTGDLALNGGGSASGTQSLGGAQIGGIRGLTGGSVTNLTLNVSGNLGMTAGAVSGAALGSVNTGGQSSSVTATVGGSITMDPGAQTGSLGTAVGSLPGSVAAGSVSLTAGGSIFLNGKAMVQSLGDVTLKATNDILVHDSRVTSGGLLTALGANLTLSADTTNVMVSGASMLANLTGALTMTGGSFGTSKHASMIANSADQTITATGITLTGGASGGGLGVGNFAQIFSPGNQHITVGAGGLHLQAGGGGATETDNYAMVLQGGTTGTVPGSTQTITVNNGGAIVMTGGSSSLTSVGQSHGSRALIQANGAAQTIDFTAGGSLDLTGGTAGSRSYAMIYADAGTQAISGLAALKLTGGASGGISGEGNWASIETNVGAQSITASSISLTGGGNVYNKAYLYSAGTQALDVVGSVNANDGSGINSFGNMTLKAANINQTAGSKLVAAGLTASTSSGMVLNGTNNQFDWLNATNTGTGNMDVTSTNAVTYSTNPAAPTGSIPTYALLDVRGLSNLGGNLVLTNFGGISTSGLVAAGGSLAMTANSPLTIGAAGATAGGNVTLTTTNQTSVGNMTLNGPVSSTAGSATFTAAGNYVQNSAVMAASSVTTSAGGSVTFGTAATTDGYPISYTAAGIAVTAPPTTVQKPAIDPCLTNPTLCVTTIAKPGTNSTDTPVTTVAGSDSVEAAPATGKIVYLPAATVVTPMVTLAHKEVVVARVEARLAEMVAQQAQDSIALAATPEAKVIAVEQAAVKSTEADSKRADAKIKEAETELRAAEVEVKSTRSTAEQLRAESRKSVAEAKRADGEVDKATAETKAAELAVKRAKTPEAKAAAEVKHDQAKAKKAEAEAKKAEVDVRKAETEVKQAEAEAKVSGDPQAKDKVDVKKAEVESKKAEVEVKKAKAELETAKAPAEKAKAEEKVAVAEVKKADKEAYKAEIEARHAQERSKESDSPVEKQNVVVKKADAEVKKADVEVKKAELEVKTAKTPEARQKAEEKHAQAEVKKAEHEVAKAESEAKVAEAVASTSSHPKARQEVESKKAEVEVKKAAAEVKKAQAEVKAAKAPRDKDAAEAKHQSAEVRKAEAELKQAEVEAKQAQDEARAPQSAYLKNAVATKAAASVAKFAAKKAELEVKKIQAEIKQVEREVSAAKTPEARAVAQQRLEAKRAQAQSQERQAEALKADADSKDTSAKVAKRSSDNKIVEVFGGMSLATMAKAQINEAMAARHEFMKESLSPALSVLQANPKAADLKTCGTGGGDVCVRPVNPALTNLTATILPRVQLAMRTPSVSFLPAIQRKVAVVIGNNAYQDPSIPSLDGAIKDADAIGAVFKDKMGYEVRMVHNGTRADIVRTLNQVSDETGSDDSVVVYYAGHGYQMEDTKMGYWIPSDASVKDPGNWISNTDINKILTTIPAKQMMVMSDSCYSGALTNEQRITAGAASDTNLQSILGKRSVLVMSSGGEEPVLDEGREGHSIFAWHLMDKLNTVTQYKNGFEVFQGVKAEVAKEGIPQTPQYGASTSAGHTSGGEYLFEVRKY